ncbi:hypothetical protein [Burkholderia sp. RF4-BP95]|uniref:hypothetical protein n=1 Tax=Burkholderia sp. RF4-BP95 TaxID=1637845 RepID=UPI000A4D1ACE|nr:hypothetical protein [Burkholderia sp. RF4-BP95]
MINYYICLAIALVSGSACAKNTCADIRGAQGYPPLSVGSGIICFVREQASDPKTEVQVGAEAISLYYIADGNPPLKAEGRGLLYDDTPGEIVDAFSLEIDQSHRKKIFVIHSMEVRDSIAEQNSSGKFYSVDVFDLAGNILRRNERASDWFGAGYSFLSDGVKITYNFPYLTKLDVRRAMESPFASLMSGDENIPVRVKFKSHLFELPNTGDKTRKYLIEGDRVTVEKVTAGWCKVKLSGGLKPLKMWLMCSALEIEDRNNKVN